MDRRLVGHTPAVPTFTRRKFQRRSAQRTHIGRMDIVLFAIKKVILPIIVLRIRMWHPRLHPYIYIFQIRHFDSGLVSRQGQVSKHLFELSLTVMEVI